MSGRRHRPGNGDRPTVLLTDAEERWTLAACRGLKRAGYGVAAVAGSRPAVSLWSVDCDERHHGPDPHLDRVLFAESLERILRGRPHAALIPGAEASLLAVSTHRDRLEPLTRIGLPPPDVMAASSDKVALAERAGAAGLPAPESVVCATPAEALDAATGFGYPVMVKPARSVLGESRAYGGRHRPSRAFPDQAALIKGLPGYGLPAILQRYERDSFVLSVSGVVADGRLLAVAASRYVRTWPPMAGSSSMSESIEPPEGLVARVLTFLQGMGWQGTFEVEVLGAPDGTHRMIDFNPRLYGSMALAVEGGANLPAVWCDWLLGRDPAFVVARPGLRYRWEEGETYNLIWRLRRGDLGGAAALMRPRPNVVHAHFRPEDPAPLAAAAIRAVSIKARRLLARTVPPGIPSTTPRPSG